jgi:hypothetical protein
MLWVVALEFAGQQYSQAAARSYRRPATRKTTVM